MPWLVRTKSGLELVCKNLSLTPDRDGFIKLVHVYRLIHPPGMYDAVPTSLVRRHGLTTDCALSFSAVELYTDKIEIDLERRQFHEK